MKKDKLNHNKEELSRLIPNEITNYTKNLLLSYKVLNEFLIRNGIYTLNIKLYNKLPLQISLRQIIKNRLLIKNYFLYQSTKRRRYREEVNKIFELNLFLKSIDSKSLLCLYIPLVSLTLYTFGLGLAYSFIGILSFSYSVFVRKENNFFFLLNAKDNLMGLQINEEYPLGLESRDFVKLLISLKEEGIFYRNKEEDLSNKEKIEDFLRKYTYLRRVFDNNSSEDDLLFLKGDYKKYCLE